MEKILEDQNGPKSGPKLDFLYSDSLQQFLRSGRDKIYEKNF